MARSPYKLRREMAALGWQSNDRLTHAGWGTNPDGSPRYGYSIWFERWDWHGQRCDRVSFGAMTDDLTKIPETVEKAAHIACRAYVEYIEYPPRMNSEGKLCPDEMLKGIWERLGMKGTPDTDTP